MMKYKMIVTDLDGTLLRNDKTISDFTGDTIASLRANGVKFVIATARPVRSVKDFLPFLDFDAGIYHNGAVICENGAVIAECGIEEPLCIVHRIMADNPGIHISVEANDVLYANFDVSSIWGKAEFVYTKDFAELKERVADKIIVEAFSLEEMKRFEKYLPENLYLQLSENRIAMIMNKRAAKSNAISVLAEKMGICMEEVVAFGDDYNDMDMLELCGKGVAVGNALEAVKDVADEVCGTNEEDGLANWIISQNSMTVIVIYGDE